MIDIRLPNITATDEAGQLAQIKSYLYQLADQLKWAFGILEGGTVAIDEVVLKDNNGNTVERESTKNEQKTLEELESLTDTVVSSAAIVKKYYDNIVDITQNEGNYVIHSDFGDGGVAQYIEDTDKDIADAAEKADSVQKYVQAKFAKGDADGEYELSEMDARILKQERCIRRGTVETTLTESGEAEGVEIGEIDPDNDKAIHRFMTLTAAGAELYDGESDAPFACISSGYDDHIIEHGTSGIWTYRKYESGIAMCWGRHVQELPEGLITAEGAVYTAVANSRIDYPVEFAEVPQEFVCAATDGVRVTATVQAGEDGLNTQTKTALYSVVGFAEHTEALMCYLDLFVVGRWK